MKSNKCESVTKLMKLLKTTSSTPLPVKSKRSQWKQGLLNISICKSIRMR